MKRIKLMTKIFKAMANEKRIKIIGLLLSHREFSVTDISQELEMPFLTVSRHLERLRSAGLVEFRQQKLQNYYSISAADEVFAREILKLIQKYL